MSDDQAHRTAAALGEAVADAWNRAHGGPDIAVPIGLVAALSLVRQGDPNGPDLKAQILAQKPHELIEMYQQIWAVNWQARPDLIDRARVLHEWLNAPDEIDDHRAYCVKVVTQAALKAGIFDLTGHADPIDRSRTDALSHVIMLLRSNGARQGLGEFHTPPTVTDVVAEATLSAFSAELAVAARGAATGQHIHDPAGGSGGMLRAAAQAVRWRGFDPADFQWSMVDVDPIAAACGAVNAIVWGLGPHVVVACDDSLANPRAVEDARAHAQAVIAHRDQVMGAARMIAAIRQTQALLESAVAA
ncbi:SAM-dependent methyltransferase [Streptomyces sp. PCS3-D2]|uniref:N-6 DNA methylase n=1 Tax=Streptomyces sp. PCS3-D2 TaxID=1460244 RepID=UPI0004467454|nr:N-6 DNA methylase [Streptomyces sp. PCS3-D2]WKV74121.1 SAM-dependent methyltransferase [Streptomyces sp. PCS3-D2]